MKEEYTTTKPNPLYMQPCPDGAKQGRWIDKGREEDVYDIKGVKTWATKGMCSECGFTTWFIESHLCYMYCPKCGAKMEAPTILEAEGE